MLRLVPRFLRSRALLPVAMGLTAVLALPALRLGFISDDNVQREALRDAGPNEAAMRLFRFVDPAMGEPPALLPWWSPADLRLSFWRPLSSLTHWADYRMARDDARWQHLHSLLWGVALTLMAGLLYRRILGPGAASGAATLLFAVDDAHAMPIAWLANRNALVASVLAMAALFAHDGWRRRGWRAGATVGPALFACALLGGELGVGMGPFLVAYALFLDPEPRLGRRLLSVAPYVAVGIVWQAGYGVLGFGAANSEMYVDPLRSPARFLVALPGKALLLLESQLGPIPVDIVPFFSVPLQHGMLVVSGAVVLLVGAALRPLIGQDRHARFFSFGMLLGLLPLCATNPGGRLLVLSGFGAFGLLGVFLAGVAEGATWMTSSRRKSLLRAFAISMILVHGPLAAYLFPAGIGTLEEADALMVRDPARQLPVGPEIGKQHLIAVATPGAYFFAMTLVQRKQLGLPSPDLFTGLATGTTPILITRVDDRTLRLEPEGGFLPPPGTLPGQGVLEPAVSLSYLNQMLDGLFRDRELPWQIGDGRDLEGVAIRVTALTADGRPAAIEARFAERLESRSYAWVVYEGRTYRPWTPPAVGEATRTDT